MIDFFPSNFFDLKDFEFKEIFEGIDYVWEAIPKISELLKGQKKKIVIGKGTKIHKSAVIQGPVVIGENCIIGPHSFIRQNCVIADNCRVGHGVEIKNSILLKGVIADHLSYIGDSVIGSNVRMAAGSITANLRLDKKEVRIKDGRRKIETGLSKFGAIIGDGSTIGINSVLNPGTILGKNTIVYPLTSVVGVHNAGERIK